MIEWVYAGVGWFDYWTTRCGSAMIARHPNHDRGDYVVWINGTRVAQANELRLAQHKTEKILRGDAR